MKTLKLGFFASHGGSNMQAIIDSCKDGRLNAEPCVVISNNSSSGAIERAKNEGIAYYHISQATHPDADEFDRALLDVLALHETDIIILAGYMKKLSTAVIRKYQNHVLNIHPALLPKYGGKGMYGMFVHEAVIAAGDKESGATVHVVDDKYDHGRILAQKKVPVIPGDKPETLAARVLKVEHILFTETLQKIATGEISLNV